MMSKEGTTPDQLFAMIRKKELAPTYLFHGEEELLASEATEQIIEQVLTPAEREFNLDIVYGSEADARNILSHAASFPMMAERRVVVIREFDKLGDKELFAPYLENPSPTTCLIIHCAKADFRTKPYVTARKHSCVVEFKPLRERGIQSWITDRFERTGYTVEPGALHLFSSYAGTSLREIQSELEKLVLFTGDRRTITTDDVTAVVGISKEHNVFELQKAIGRKNVERSLFILERMMDAGESPIMIIVMLSRYFTVLWKLHDLRRRRVPQKDHAREAGVPPYYIQEYEEACSLFGQSDVERAFTVLAKADEQLKSSGPSHKVVMNMALMSLVGADQEPMTRRLVG